MASYNPPKKNTAFVMYVGLRSQADTRLLQANPTLASGDAKVSKDGGALANLTTLPSVIASSAVVKIELSSTEMNADNVTILLSDASGGQWCDLIINLQTAATQFDDLATATIADAVWDEARSGHATAGSFGEGVVVNSMAAGSVTAAAIATGAIDADAIADNAIDAGAIATGAITSAKFAAGAIDAAAIAAGAIDADALASDAGTELGTAVWATAARTLTSSLDPTAATIADAVWDEARAGHVGAGSFGEGVVVNNMAAGSVTAAAIATNAIDADAIATDAVTELQSGLATAASVATVAGYLDTEVAAILAAVDTEVTAIKTKTDYLPSATAGAAGGVFIAGSNAATTVDFTGNLSGSVGSVTGAVGSVTGNVGGNVTGSVGSLAAQAKTDVNTEVVDALSVDTYGEPSSVPAATSSVKDKIGWMFMLSRNKRMTTASADKVRNDADSSDVGTATLTEDGSTFTRGEYA